ncbi:uncharacterized protein LOC141630186 [Silene latifolia]|uniref:uncharacterized protein LOC141630186 n=1 Tax=Silene latifolia TaxID=37657 RepID=UPI003D7707B6
MAMVQEIQKLHEKFEKIPGVPTSIEEAKPESYAYSPFVDEITKIDLPKKFVVSSMRNYDGIAYPQNHVAYYKKRMLAASIPSELPQVYMCKGIGTALTGPALQWYINLPNGSIKFIADLINMFNHQFTSRGELEKRSSDLYRIKQKPGETIRAFLTRFNKEKVSIPICDVGTAVEGFRQGLPVDSDFYDELTMKPCLTFEDVQAKALGYIRLEEDKSFMAETTDSVSGYKRSNRKSSNHREAAPDHLPTPGLTDQKSTMLTSNEGISDIHQNSLVITMQIGTARLLRILVGGGSSVNLIMLDALKAMKIDENQIIKKSNVLIGFSGETNNTLGEIYLPTYVEGVSSYETFGVLDCLSSNNSILGRPWIQNVRAIPSTYNQCVKIPTQWGIKETQMKTDQLVSDPEYPDVYEMVGSDVPDNKNGKLRVCVDYRDLNKACPKEPFPIPHIDAMVDATAGHELLTFMDASRATYQRLVNMMFKDQIGDIMEVYIDDMVVKSKKVEDHMKDLEVAFKILEGFNMNLNPSK